MVMGCLYFLHDLLSKSKVITQLGEIIVKTLKKKNKKQKIKSSTSLLVMDT